MRTDYDIENDIYYILWGKRCKYSIELFDGQVVLDFDKNDEPVGVEIFNFKEQVKKHNNKMNKIFKSVKKFK